MPPALPPSGGPPRPGVPRPGAGARPAPAPAGKAPAAKPAPALKGAAGSPPVTAARPAAGKAATGSTAKLATKKTGVVGKTPTRRTAALSGPVHEAALKAAKRRKAILYMLLSLIPILLGVLGYVYYKKQHPVVVNRTEDSPDLKDKKKADAIWAESRPKLQGIFQEYEPKRDTLTDSEKKAFVEKFEAVKRSMEEARDLYNGVMERNEKLREKDMEDNMSRISQSLMQVRKILSELKP